MSESPQGSYHRINCVTVSSIGYRDVGALQPHCIGEHGSIREKMCRFDSLPSGWSRQNYVPLAAE